MNTFLLVTFFLLSLQVSAQYSLPRRIIVENIKNFSSAGEPVIDADRVFWRSLSLDTNETIDNWRFRTADELYPFYGFNLSDSVLASPGRRVLVDVFPGVNATLIDYKLGAEKTYKIQMDNHNPLRQFIDWFQVGIGNIAVMSVAPNVVAFYGGLSNTTKIETGHILSFGFWQLLKNGSNWQIPANRERIYWISRYPAFSKASSQGLVNPVTGAPVMDQYIPLYLTFEDGSNGEALTIARNTVDKLTGERLTKTTTTINSPVSTLVAK